MNCDVIPSCARQLLVLKWLTTRNAFHNVKQTRASAVGVNVSSVQSLERAVSLLAILAERPGSPLGAISKAAGLHPATTRRLLFSLETLGCVYQSPTSRRYYLGGQLMYLGHKAAVQFPFREAARPEMEKLAEITHETIYLAILNGDDVLYLEVVEGSQTVGMRTGVGDRCPAHSTATGRVLLGYLPEDKLDIYLKQEFLPQTKWTTTDPAQLKRIILEARQTGINLTIDEQIEGLSAFASPVLGPDGKAMAAIGVGVPNYRLSDELTATIRHYVPYYAERISAKFSGRSGSKRINTDGVGAEVDLMTATSDYRGRQRRDPVDR